MAESNKILIHDPDIIGEISTFIEVRGRYQADDGYHDDLVMTLVLLAWLTTQPFFKDLTDMNLRKVLFDEQAKQIEEELTPFGVILNGIDEKDIPEVFTGDLWFEGDVDAGMVKLMRKRLENV
jgi:hypothetical protein